MILLSNRETLVSRFIIIPGRNWAPSLKFRMTSLWRVVLYFGRLGTTKVSDQLVLKCRCIFLFIIAPICLQSGFVVQKGCKLSFDGCGSTCDEQHICWATPILLEVVVYAVLRSIVGVIVHVACTDTSISNFCNTIPFIPRIQPL